MWSSGFNRRVDGTAYGTLAAASHWRINGTERRPFRTSRGEEVRFEHAVGRSAAAALDGSIKPRRQHLLQSLGERHGVNAIQGRHGVSLATRARVV